MQEKLTASILGYLGDSYVCGGVQVKGQAISYLRTALLDDGWRGLGNLADFEYLVETLGFKVVPGKNSRGNNARVVTRKEA